MIGVCIKILYIEFLFAKDIFSDNNFIKVVFKWVIVTIFKR